MKTKKKTYYQYVADIKETTCRPCSENAGNIFTEETKPELPIHPNCRCKLVLIQPYENEIPDLSNITYSEWYLEYDNNYYIKPFKKLPHPWLKISLSDTEFIFYNLDGEVFITTDGFITIKYIQPTDKLLEFLYSLKAISLYDPLFKHIKNLQMSDPIAKPILSTQDNYQYYRMDDGTTLRAYMPHLQGIGILPNGTIIIGQDRNQLLNDHYLELLFLKNKHAILKKDKSLSYAEYNREYDKIYEKAIYLIKNRYPDRTEEEILKTYYKYWYDLPDDYYFIYDVTEKINEIVVENYLNNTKWNDIKESGILNRTKNFFNEVKRGAPIDLKSQSEWQKHPLYIYDGEIVDLDALGNILYGVLGAYLDISIEGLYYGASAAQTWDNKELTFDDPRDVRQWLQGINLYFDKWHEGD
jgi:hypothetical protein